MSSEKENHKKEEAQQTDAERRAFLKQLGAASLVALGAGWAALAPAHWPLSLKDPDGERGKPRKKIFKLPDGGFSVQESSVLPGLGIARGKTIDTSVRAAVDTIGGMSRFVQNGGGTMRKDLK